MADTNVRPGQIDGIRVGLTTYMSNDASQRAKIDQTLTTLAITQHVTIETQIATSTTQTYTPANVFGSAGNFKFVMVLVQDSSASTSMQIEINNTGNLNAVGNGIIYGGDASTSQVEIRNNDGSNTMDVVIVFGR